MSGRRPLAAVLTPLAAGLAALVLWQLVVVVQGIPAYVLPSPTAILAQLSTRGGDVLSALLATGSNALVGLVAGSVAGVLAAVLAARAQLVDELLSPVAAALSALPIVAVAPLLNTMFSATSSLPRRLLVAIVVFFPMFVTTLRGLRQVDPVHRALLQSYAASAWDLTRTVRLPGAVPFACTGLRVASSTAVIAAVVAEYFGGLQDGLGSRITSAAASTAYARAWAYVVGAVVLGLLFYAAALLVERVASPAPPAPPASPARPGWTESRMPRTPRPRLALGLAAAAVAALAACSTTVEGGTPAATGSEGALTPVKLQLQWVTQAQFAGYFAAAEQGFYEAEGLDVEILEGGTDIPPQTVLAQGGADYAIAWVPKALASREEGAQITDVGQVFQRSGTLQVSFKEQDLSQPALLRGKKVGNWGFGNEYELFAGMTKAGLDPGTDVSLVQQQFDMQGLLNGDIDAAQAMVYNEYAQVLEAENPETGELYQPSDLAVIDWNVEGTAMLQDAIWADTTKLQDAAYREQTVKFLKASLKGWAYCRDDAEACRDIVVAKGSKLGASHQLWQMNEVNKLIWPSPAGAGMVDEKAWAQTVTIAQETKNASGDTVLTEEPAAEAYSNDYVEQALEQLREEGVDVTGESFEPITVTLEKGGA